MTLYHTKDNCKNKVHFWKHFVAWAKERAKHRGLIKYPKDSGRGYWELNKID